ncbi:hypothetical protein [Acetobacter sicerae]|uniref:hypothetical protein n=1 Tax=Acetobacter sicerae TaxID=85325 RepID=UPI00156AEA57|nr:hypothetical protein [Acetobacter sicerae]NHN93761.1 hypothetical protein [Acetobacter sicerae]
MDYYSDNYTAAQEDRLNAMNDAYDALAVAMRQLKALGDDTPAEFDNAEGPMLDLAGDLKVCIEQFDDTLRQEATDARMTAAEARRDALQDA